MKFKITMKTPDIVSTEMTYAAEQIADCCNRTKQDRRDVIDLEYAKIGTVVDRFFKYREFVTIEIDTEAGTATVVPRF